MSHHFAITHEAIAAAARAIEDEVKKYPINPDRKPWEPAPMGASMYDLAVAALSAAVPVMQGMPVPPQERS